MHVYKTIFAFIIRTYVAIEIFLFFEQLFVKPLLSFGNIRDIVIIL